MYSSAHFFFFVFHIIGPCPPKSINFLRFLCDHLLKLPDAGNYVELKENPPLLRLNNLDKISDIYCDYQDQKTGSGKKLNREKKERPDNLNDIIEPYEKTQPPSLKKVGNGVMYGKEFLACEIKDNALWCSLKGSFRLMVIQYLLNYYICIGNSTVSSAIWKKHTLVNFEVFEKLTSVCFFKVHEKPYYFLLIIYMKKFRVNYIFIC